LPLRKLTKARRTVEGAQRRHFTYFLKFPNNQGAVIALTATTNAYKRAVCRFSPIKILGLETP
jgi:hypothetical protein